MRRGFLLPIASAFAVAAQVDSTREIPTGVPLSRDDSASLGGACDDALPDPSPDFPCTEIEEGGGLLCPEGKIRWMKIQVDRNGCPMGMDHASVEKVAGETRPPLPGIPYRAVWIEDGTLSPILFRAAPSVVAIGDGDRLVLWSADGGRKLFRNRNGDTLRIDQPRAHRLEPGHDLSTWIRRDGPRWEFLQFSTTTVKPSTPGRNPSSFLLAYRDPAGAKQRIHWSALSRDTLKSPRASLVDRSENVLRELRPSRSTPTSLYGALDAVGLPDTVWLLLKDSTGLRSISRVLGDTLLSRTEPPPPPAPTGSATWTRPDSPGPWVFAWPDRIRWATGAARTRIVAASGQPGEEWSYRFDAASPGIPQRWEFSNRIPRIDSLRKDGSRIAFRIRWPKFPSCLALVFGHTEPNLFETLGPGRPGPMSPESTPWALMGGSNSGRDFLALAGWSYASGQQEPRARPPGSGTLRSEAASAATPGRPVARVLDMVCPDAEGEYRIERPIGTRTSTTMEAYGIGETGVFAFRLDLPKIINR